MSDEFSGYSVEVTGDEGFFSDVRRALAHLSRVYLNGDPGSDGDVVTGTYTRDRKPCPVSIIYRGKPKGE